MKNIFWIFNCYTLFYCKIKLGPNSEGYYFVAERGKVSYRKINNVSLGNKREKT